MTAWPYYTKRWINLRAKVLRERPTCEECEYTESKAVDHVKAWRDDGEVWDRANLVALCVPCHNRKTRREQGERGQMSRVRREGPKVRGVDASTGIPLDRGHWWNA